jgi:N-formylglutamate amidohydrolase
MGPHSEEMESRIIQYYNPYHEQLRHILSAGGLQGMFDCHSLWGIGPSEAPDTGKARSDIILGNNGDNAGNPTPHRGKTTCPPKILRMMAEIFKKNGFSVSMNHPYAGGFITTHYGDRLAAANCFAVQIEINQDLYVPPGEQRLLPDKIEQTRNNIFHALDRIAGNL